MRGPVRQLRSDRGTNFVGAERELRKALGEVDYEKVSEFLIAQSCDYVQFKMNVPAASHMGGVWERQIRSVRAVLAGILLTHGQQLDDESLRTFLVEAAAIINSRPLTVECLSDPTLEPLTPNQLLTGKSKVVLPPPGHFQSADLYSRKRWRRVQYLANQFWYRWRREYLQNLQVRNKWVQPRRNIAVGDIVLVKDESIGRFQWPMGRIESVTTDRDGQVRKVKVFVPTLPAQILERPVHKLVVLIESH